MRSILRVGSVLVLGLAVANTGFSQAPAPQTAPPTQNRIPQQIIVNGQTVNGAYVPAATGGMQSYTCPNPQEYTTPDGAARGWACYDSTTNVWLLNALPPAQAAQPTQAPLPAQPAAQSAPAAPAAPAQPQAQQGPPPPVVYTQPTVVYTTPYPPYPLVYGPAYPPGVIIGAAAIDAFGRIAAASIFGSHRYYYPYYYRGWRR